MGEVYRARDMRLGRDVAVKVLPTGSMADPERQARFGREAHLLASLNHPHIEAIYGVESLDGRDVLILELVPGETLRARLGRGPMASRQALLIARQIAEALEAAHEAEIVHRDLKPANIQITENDVVKVLDFGLAKSIQIGAPTPDLTQAPTVTGEGTLAGTVLGTAAYMSPEQARGRPVDKRTDIWAYGCVLFELVAGRPPFSGETLPDTIAAVLEREPDWSALPATTAAPVRHLLRRCLEKDARRRLRDIGDARTDLDEALGDRRPALLRLWMASGATVAVAAALAAGAGLWWLANDRPRQPETSYVQITSFPDSATQPALSPDGRMLTFIRGAGTFFTPGQIYVKQLPAGEPVQLTNDDLKKMSPVFSPDGSRVAYTTVKPGQIWDTWTASVLGGRPQLWLPNASGLVWTSPGRLLFSEIKTGQHMGIVAAAESRAEARDVYLPSHTRGMAHHSYQAPDGQSVLLVEMDGTGGWIPCRVVPSDGSSAGRQVGPPAAPCTSAAWSPDGQWIYLSVYTESGFHVWRERVRGGRPEQVTSGPNEEEGIAMAPDGGSFISSVGLKQRVVSIHDAGGERAVSAEGYAYQPLFSPDGRKLYYRILSGGGQTPNLEKSELWVADLESGRRELLLPGFAVTGYDISDDGRRIVFAALDTNAKPHLWLGATDRRVPPRPLPNVDAAIYPSFGPGGQIFFVAADGARNFAYRIREDGTGKQQLLDQPVNAILGVSPDGQWLVGFSPVSSDEGARMVSFAYPMAGGAPVRLYDDNWFTRWSADMKSVYIQVWSVALDSGGSGNTYVLPARHGSALPDIPLEGVRSEAELAAVPGVRVISHADVRPGVTNEVYAFSAAAVQRNLYRIPIRRQHH